MSKSASRTLLLLYCVQQLYTMIHTHVWTVVKFTCLFRFRFRFWMCVYISPFMCSIVLA